MAFVIGTDGTFGVPFIVAMGMEREFVAEFLTSALTLWRDVIYLNVIAVSEEQSAPPTLALLVLQEFAKRSVEHVMGTQSLTPVQQVAVVGASRSFHFDMSLDMRVGMIPQL